MNLRTLACAGGALLAAGTLNAQEAPRACPGGEADDQGIEVNITVLAHPTRVAATVDSVLQAQGYTVHGSPAGLGRWHVEPRFTWMNEMVEEDLHGPQHPGVQVIAYTEARGDSTHLVASARALCKVPAVDGDDPGERVEILSAAFLTGGVMEALDSLRARGEDPMARVPRTQPEQGAVVAPPQVGEFRLVGRHDYDNPAMGTTVRYGRDDDDLTVDVYVYPGVEVTPECDAACAVNTEADGFVGDFPDLIQAGHYQSLDVVADERLQPAAGARWAYGRHLRMKVRRQGRELESEYWVFAMPGFFLKARSSFPASSASRDAVQKFVDALPGAVMPARD